MFAHSQSGADRDVIAFEQRGNLHAQPNLTCERSMWWDEAIAWLEAMSTAGILILLGSVLTMLVGGLIWLVKRRRTPTKISASAVFVYFLALLTAVMVLALPLLLTMINNQYLNNGDYLVRIFGTGRGLLPADLLAFGAPIMVILLPELATIALWAWIKGRWSIQLRLLVAVVILAALPMIYVGFRWDLFSKMI